MARTYRQAQLLISDILGSIEIGQARLCEMPATFSIQQQAGSRAEVEPGASISRDALCHAPGILAGDSKRLRRAGQDAQLNCRQFAKQTMGVVNSFRLI